MNNKFNELFFWFCLLLAAIGTLYHSVVSGNWGWAIFFGGFWALVIGMALKAGNDETD
jgi:hypothetical protein